MFGFGRKKRPTFEAQLETLAGCGIALRPDRTIDDLLISWPREEYESQPYGLLLFMLGGEVEAEPWGRRFCDSVYSFDSECVEGDGDYSARVGRLAAMAGPDLPIQNVTDEVDLEAGTARIEFDLDGRTHHIEPSVNDDWFDPAVIEELARLLAARGGERRFFSYDTGDQNIVIVCITPEQAKALTKSTGLGLARLG